ncbi:MAG: DNA-binding transcriptional regulator [Planctomycetia bacterium]|nr:DNA-binding transcriptional regulator [Planctomycetia bacterium]
MNISTQARQNKGRQAKKVAVFVSLANAYGREVLQGITQYAKENGPWRIHLDYEFSRWQFPPWLRHWRGDGIISRISSEEMYDFSRKTGIPVIDLNERVPSLGLPLLYNDQVAVGRMAAEHLLERDYSEFGYIGQQGYLWSDERCRGFCDRIRESGGTCSVFKGLRFDDRIVDNRFEYRNSTWERERPRIQAWIRALPKPVGILACNSFRAIQLLEEAEAVHLSVPEVVAIISGDNEEIACEMVSPTISGVILNSKEIGYRAAELLARAMNGEELGHYERYIPPLGIAVRTSTQVYKVAHPVIQQALEFIRENARYDISVPDVAACVDLSTTKLQRLFRVELNKTVLEQILNEKIEIAKILLRTTNLSIEEIAIKSGFNHPQRLSEAFVRKTGIRPGKFRKQPHLVPESDVAPPHKEKRTHLDSKDAG